MQKGSKNDQCWGPAGADPFQWKTPGGVFLRHHRWGQPREPPPGHPPCIAHLEGWKQCGSSLLLRQTRRECPPRRGGVPGSRGGEAGNPPRGTTHTPPGQLLFRCALLCSEDARHESPSPLRTRQGGETQEDMLGGPGQGPANHSPPHVEEGTAEPLPFHIEGSRRDPLIGRVQDEGSTSLERLGARDSETFQPFALLR